MSKSEELRRGDIDFYLNELAKEIKKKRGRNYKVEIIIVGGAAILLNGHGFRESTMDIDAFIQQNASIKDCIYAVADKFQLSNDWLNSDFQYTASYSPEIITHSRYYKEFRQCLTVRYVADEELLAMKLKSFRSYKHDHSDIIGILSEQYKNGSLVSKDAILASVEQLYGSKSAISQDAMSFLDNAFANIDSLSEKFDSVNLEESKKRELIDIADKAYAGVLNQENVEDILEKIRKKKQTEKG